LGFPLSCSRIESYSYVEFFLQVLARVTIGFLDISFLLYVLYNCMYAVVLFLSYWPGGALYDPPDLGVGFLTPPFQVRQID